MVCEGAPTWKRLRIVAKFPWRDSVNQHGGGEALGGLAGGADYKSSPAAGSNQRFPSHRGDLAKPPQARGVFQICPAGLPSGGALTDSCSSFPFFGPKGIMEKIPRNPGYTGKFYLSGETIPGYTGKFYSRCLHRECLEMSKRNLGVFLDIPDNIGGWGPPGSPPLQNTRRGGG